MNVVILLAGKSFTKDNLNKYPLCLTEISGKPLIEILIKKWENVDVNFAIMLRKCDIEKYHLDSVVKQINQKAKVYSINAPTSGAVCTALMAIEQININEPLVVLNGDELLDIDYTEPLNFFYKSNFDAGTIIFDSVHPRYSYVKIENDIVEEVAEKNPISRNATAGFYWYRRGSDFVSAAFNFIQKHPFMESSYFICPVFNELILKDHKIGAFKIQTKAYTPLKSEQQISKFHSLVESLYESL